MAIVGPDSGRGLSKADEEKVPSPFDLVTELAGRGFQIVLPPCGGTSVIEDFLAAYGFKTEDTELGLKVRFVQPKGMSLKNLMDSVNACCRQELGKIAVDIRSLEGEEGLEDEAAEDVAHEFVAVMRHSEDKSFEEQKVLFESMVSIPALAAAAGLFRLKEGFPVDPDSIGLATDPGDLLKGKFVRCRSEAVLGCFGYGVAKRGASLNAFSYVFAGGVPKQ